MARLEFGKPQDALQAYIRLPDRSHKDYQTDSVIEHLVHFKEAVMELMAKAPELKLEDRWIPIELEDLSFMEHISFRREPKLTVQWEQVRQDSSLSELFETGDDEYRWWQISHMIPDLEVSGYTLVCIESNRQFGGPKKYRFNALSKFDIFLMTPEEEQMLSSELTRNNKPADQP